MNLRNAYAYASAALRYTRLYLDASKEPTWLRSVSLMLSVPNNIRALGTLRLNPGIAELSISHKPALRVTLPRLHDLWTEANARPDRLLWTVVAPTDAGWRYVKSAPNSPNAGTGGLYFGTTPAMFETRAEAVRYAERLCARISREEYAKAHLWRVVSGRFDWSIAE